LNNFAYTVVHLLLFYILTQPDDSLLQAKTRSWWFYIKIYVVFDGCIYWFIIYKHNGM